LVMSSPLRLLLPPSCPSPFPYTTLFRSRGDALGDLVGVVHGRQARADVEELPDTGVLRQVADGAAQEVPVSAGVLHDLREEAHRSEVHTSELQSRENPGCRFLLEKKKT